MGNPATRDEILDQIRRMPLEDRDYIEAELLRDGYEAGRRVEDPAQIAELVRRAGEALTRPDAGLSREEDVARARAAVEVVRARKS
jgi:Complex 1 protein (LYR family)